VQGPVDEKAASYVRMPYTRMLIPDPEEGGFIAEVLELPGCLSQGETPEEAFRNLNDAMGGYIASLLDRGYSVPEPVGMKEYPGRFLLRISSELHRAAATRAMREGVSLNQWIGQAIAERLAAKNLADEIFDRLKAALPIQVSASTTMNLRIGDLDLQDRKSGANEDQSWQAAMLLKDVTRQITGGRRPQDA
jgi:antitoxin HicB